MNHNFGEKREEYSIKSGKNVPVWMTPKYEVSRAKAIEVIESKQYGLEDGDFWILMNETKSGKMAYTGLITSHNACLKINDVLKDKFRPSCVSIDKEGYGGSLVCTYCCDEQGIYEVGEVSKDNCKNAYPYAMAYKRLFDRVVLKLSKLAYAGVYSEAESDEFKDPIDRPVESADKQTMTKEMLDALYLELNRTGIGMKYLLANYGLKQIEDMNCSQWKEAIGILKGKEDK